MLNSLAIEIEGHPVNTVTSSTKLTEAAITVGI
jgi:hypothetical protein